MAVLRGIAVDLTGGRVSGLGEKKTLEILHKKITTVTTLFLMMKSTTLLILFQKKLTNTGICTFFNSLKFSVHFFRVLGPLHVPINVFFTC